MGTYRVVWSRGDNADGVAGAGGGERVEGGHEELRGAGADDDVVLVPGGGVADGAVEAAHLAAELGLQEPAHVADVGEVAHRLPPWDHDLRQRPRLPPERLEHGRVPAAPDTHTHTANKMSTVNLDFQSQLLLDSYLNL